PALGEDLLDDPLRATGAGLEQGIGRSLGPGHDFRNAVTVDVVERDLVGVAEVRAVPGVLADAPEPAVRGQAEQEELRGPGAGAALGDDHPFVRRVGVPVPPRAHPAFATTL